MRATLHMCLFLPVVLTLQEWTNQRRLELTVLHRVWIEKCNPNFIRQQIRTASGAEQPGADWTTNWSTI
jgi:hypothetical protein